MTNPPSLPRSAAEWFTSNGQPIPNTRPYFRPTEELAAWRQDPEGLQALYDRDGFVVLRGVLDPSEVVELRRKYFSAFPDRYFVPGSDRAEGRFSGRRPTDLPRHGVAGHPAHAFVRSDAFNRFVSAEPLAEAARTLIGGPVDLLPRRILRHFDRSAPTASRAHTDFRYLDEGSDRVVTAWIPLGPTPRETGSLVYQAGSHRMSDDRLAVLREVNDRPGDTRPLSHDLAWVAEELATPWSWADFAPGDVALHSPYVVHASLDTTTEIMRASIDVRFLARGAPADPRWLEPWAGDDGN